MIKKISKTKAREKVEKFFSNIKSKSPKEIKKIKKISASYNIKLGNKKKLFCKKCLAPYIDSKTRINKKTKIITCGKCKSVSRWKLKQNTT
jgi:RNase P subunit RPR2|tara:strand:- start:116 stop:388 length:273 start_codon:yes stop_codon:yes gene_type:complete